MNIIQCMHCKLETLHDLLCENCLQILPLDHEIDFFKIFGIEQAVEIDLQTLRKNGLDLIAKYHPDQFSNKNQSLLDIATANASLINRAIKILSDVTSRVEYLLSLRKIDVNAYQASSLPQKILLLFLEWQEESNNANTIEELTDLLSRIRKQLDTNYQEIKRAFISNNNDTMTFLCVKRKFLDRLVNNIKRKIECLYDDV
jgi:Fe-S protein assembly co-chaperone HscB